MRLKGDDQTPLRDRPCRSNHCCDLSRVMSVIFDDDDTACLTAALKAALGAVKPAKASRDITPRNAELPRHRDSRQRVEHVVASRNSQLQLPELDRAATGLSPANGARRPESLQLHVGRDHVGRLVEAVCDDVPLDLASNRSEVRIVRAHDHRAIRGHSIGELHEGRLQIVEAVDRLRDARGRCS